jgi:hypothetical protein
MSDERALVEAQAREMTRRLHLAVLACCERGATVLEMLDELSPAWPGLTLDGLERMARQVSDRRHVARRYLESKSLQMAQNVVDKGSPSDHVKALSGLAVIGDDERAGGGVTIIVNGTANIALFDGPAKPDK